MSLPDCAKSCLKVGSSCKEGECRMWIDYEKDQNCCLISIENNGGKPLTLHEVANRLKLHYLKVRQIQIKAIGKLRKNIKI